MCYHNIISMLIIKLFRSEITKYNEYKCSKHDTDIIVSNKTTNHKLVKLLFGENFVYISDVPKLSRITFIFNYNDPDCVQNIINTILQHNIKCHSQI